jgi:hypothetical protein
MVAMTHPFFVIMCKGKAQGDVEQRMMPADYKHLNSALAISSLCGSRWRAFAKMRGGGR